jgi:hypothetical protein
MRCGAATALPLLLLSFPLVFVIGRRAGQLLALPGFWALCATLVSAGVGSFAKAILDATDANVSRGRRIAGPAVHIVLGSIYAFGGCGGFWAFTVRALQSGS